MRLESTPAISPMGYMDVDIRTPARENAFISKSHTRSFILIPVTMSSSSQTTLDPFLSTPTPLGSRRGEHRQINGKSWLQVTHIPNIRRGSRVSRIWEHGAEYIDLSTDLPINHWICDHCDTVIKLSRSQTTWNISRHLLKTHGIKTKRVLSEVNNESQDESQDEASLPDNFAALVARINVVKFRKLLVRWIV